MKSNAGCFFGRGKGAPGLSARLSALKYCAAKKRPRRSVFTLSEDAVNQSFTRTSLCVFSADIFPMSLTMRLLFLILASGEVLRSMTTLLSEISQGGVCVPPYTSPS